MPEQCVHILLTGQNKGKQCKAKQYKGNFTEYSLYCYMHQNLCERYEEKIGDYHIITEKTDIPCVENDTSCFIIGTRVLTDCGYLNIEDVTLDHKLMSSTGHYQKINELIQKVRDEMR